MGFVAALLSVKVYLAARTGPVPRVVLPPKTLLARPRFDPRPVHREMLVRQIRLRLREHPLEKRLGDLLVQQPLPILAEHRVVPHLLVHLHPHKPPKQQVVLQLFHQQPFAPPNRKSAGAAPATTAPEQSTVAPHPHTASQIAATSLSECRPPSPGSAAADDRSARASPAIHN